MATMLASAGNYVLNLMLARWLEPAEFADANLMLTLMLLVTAAFSWSAPVSPDSTPPVPVTGPTASTPCSAG